MKKSCKIRGSLGQDSTLELPQYKATFVKMCVAMKFPEWFYC